MQKHTRTIGTHHRPEISHAPTRGVGRCPKTLYTDFPEGT